MNKFIDPNLNNFYKQYSLEKRSSLSKDITIKYPNKIPIIIGRSSIKNVPNLVKTKYICSNDITFDKFIVDVRKNLEPIDKNKTLFFFSTNGSLINYTERMDILYEKYKNEDGFFYILYNCETAFG